VHWHALQLAEVQLHYVTIRKRSGAAVHIFANCPTLTFKIGQPSSCGPLCEPGQHAAAKCSKGDRMAIRSALCDRLQCAVRAQKLAPRLPKKMDQPTPRAHFWSDSPGRFGARLETRFGENGENVIKVQFQNVIKVQFLEGGVINQSSILVGCRALQNND